MGSGRQGWAEVIRIGEKVRIITISFITKVLGVLMSGAPSGQAKPQRPRQSR